MSHLSDLAGISSTRGETMPKGNRTNHPPRQGVPITPSKGGRTKTKTFFLTEEEHRKLTQAIKKSGLSANDWLAAILNY